MEVETKTTTNPEMDFSQKGFQNWARVNLQTLIDGKQNLSIDEAWKAQQLDPLTGHVLKTLLRGGIRRE